MGGVGIPVYLPYICQKFINQQFITMKKIRFIAAMMIAIVAAVCFDASAKSNKVEGIWKLETLNGKPTSDVKYKVLRSDGTLTILLSHDNGRTFTVQTEGTYAMAMPGVYVEHLNHITLSVPATYVPISYTINKDVMSIEYYWWGGNPFAETWRKVKGNDYKHATHPNWQILDSGKHPAGTAPACKVRVKEE